MFDTLQVAKRIRNARIAKNMTQMALADAMGVTYQAVSNWERGNSMPDISKLPELCALLGTTFEELVGADRPETAAVCKVMDGKPMTAAEAAEVAPILPPETLQKAVQETAAKDVPIDTDTLLQLAPFLQEADLDALAKRCAVTDFSTVIALAPFLSEQTLEALVFDAAGNVTPETDSLIALAPFLSDATLDRLAQDAAVSDWNELIALAPFFSEQTLDKLIQNADITKAFDTHIIVALAPFLSKQTLHRFVDQLTQRKDYQDISEISSFL